MVVPPNHPYYIQDFLSIINHPFWRIHIYGNPHKVQTPHCRPVQDNALALADQPVARDDMEDYLSFLGGIPMKLLMLNH